MTIGITHSTAADDTFSDAGVIAWDASHTISGGTAGSILYVNASGGMTEDNANLKWGTVAGQGLTAKAGTAASAVSAFDLSQTWNYNTAAITGVKWTFTDTSSHASTLAFQILGGAAGTTNLFSLTKNGLVTIPSAINTGGGRFGSAFDAGYYSSVAFGIASNASLAFAQSGSSNDTKDGNISRISAGLIGIGTGAAGSYAGSLKLTNTQNVGYQELDEMTAPAGAANAARVFTQDNGAGKTQLMCIFGSGAAIQLAIEA